MLTKRLAAIYELVEENSVVYDVGSDHAFLPCALVKNKKCPHAFAGDNKKGPLENAKKNIRAQGLEDQIEAILYDGIDERIEADTIVLSGLGYYTVEKILDRADLKKYKEIIVQVNQDVMKLRKYISDHGYAITKEKVVYDGFYYEIVAFSAHLKGHYSLKECYLGPLLMKEKDVVYLDSLRQKKKILEDIFAKVAVKDSVRMTYYEWLKEILGQ